MPEKLTDTAIRGAKPRKKPASWRMAAASVWKLPR